MKTFLRGVESLTLLLVRVGFGAILFYRGLTRVLNDSADYVATLEAAGLPWATVFFWGTVVLEIGGGAMLAAGLLTRLVGAFFVAEFAMTTAWIHWWNGFFVADGGYEFAVTQGLLALIFVGCGGGLLAVDHLIFGRRKDQDQESGQIEAITT